LKKSKLKKPIFLLLALSLISPAAAQAASNYETEVEWGVNFRADASSNAYKYRMLPKGEDIHVIEEANSHWLKIHVQDGTTGYISSNPKYTDYTPSAASSTGNGTITKGVNFRSTPKVTNNKLDFLSSGTQVEVLEQTNSWWVKIRHNGQTGYVSDSYISFSGKAASNISSSNSSADSSQYNNDNKAGNIIAFSKSLLGKVSYDYGTRNPSRLIFDCSSFTEYVFARYGVDLKWGTRYQQYAGNYVSKSNLRKGDLVFFGTSSRNSVNHVGIYIGNGQFIHNKPSADGLAIDQLNKGYWQDHYIKARRVL
jgi:cell wall-associated NlpC family hydrolase